MGKRLAITLFVAALTAGVSAYRPYILSVPLVGGQWTFFQWAGRLIPVVASTLFISAVFEQKERKKKTILEYGIIGLLLFYVLSLLYFSITLYRLWSSSPLGKYFLPPQSTLYQDVLWRFIQPYLWTVLGSIIVAVGCIFLNAVRRRPVLPYCDVLLLVAIALVLGFERMVAALIVGLILAMCMSLIERLRGRKYLVRLSTPMILSFWFCLFWGSELLQLVFGI